MTQPGICTRLAIAVAVLGAAVGGEACRSRDAALAKTQPQIIWRQVGSWSGRGNSQTESFTSDSGALRVRWETKRAAGVPDNGTFRLVAHSAISGRVLQPVVDQRGAGSGVDYVSQDPHVFYMSVEAAGLDWTFSVDEGIAGEIVGDPHR